MNIHPFADKYPYMIGDDWIRFVESIKRHGQEKPIELLPDGTLIDGRNRLKACNELGIEPRFITVDPLNRPENPYDTLEQYIVVVNGDRRHLPQGTVAMGIAIAYPENDDKGGGSPRTRALLQVVTVSSRALAKQVGIPYPRITEARIILRYAPELVDAILAGSGPFSVAYQRAKKNKADQEELDRVKKELAQKAPDLVNVIEENNATIEEIQALLAKRKKLEDDRKRAASVLNKMTEQVEETGTLPPSKPKTKPPAKPKGELQEEDLPPEPGERFDAKTQRKPSTSPGKPMSEEDRREADARAKHWSKVEELSRELRKMVDQFTKAVDLHLDYMATIGALPTEGMLGEYMYSSMLKGLQETVDRLYSLYNAKTADALIASVFEGE